MFDWHHKISYFHLATKHHPVPVITSQCTWNSNGAQIAAIQQSAYGTANLTVRIYFQTTVGNLFLVRRLVAVDQMGEDITAKRFVCKEIRREREDLPTRTKNTWWTGKNKLETLWPFFLLTSQRKVLSLCLAGCIIVWRTLGGRLWNPRINFSEWASTLWSLATLRSLGVVPHR